MLTAVLIIIKTFGSYKNVTQVLEGKIYTLWYSQTTEEYSAQNRKELLNHSKEGIKES